MDAKLTKIYDAIKKIYKCTCKKSDSANVKPANVTRGRSAEPKKRINSNKTRAESAARKNAATILKEAGIAPSGANISVFKGARKSMNQAAAINYVKTMKNARSKARKNATAAKKAATKKPSNSSLSSLSD